jgi:hypothetical protein
LCGRAHFRVRLCRRPVNAPGLSAEYALAILAGELRKRYEEPAARVWPLHIRVVVSVRRTATVEVRIGGPSPVPYDRMPLKTEP